MTEWETEEEILRSMGNGQYEDYLIVSADEAKSRVAELEAENRRLREFYAAQKAIWDVGVLQATSEQLERLMLARQAVSEYSEGRYERRCEGHCKCRCEKEAEQAAGKNG